jgi:hypothetical protein
LRGFRARELDRSDYRARPAVQHELSILALLKGVERYIYVYDDSSRDSLLDVIRDHAADPVLSLTWFDAAVLCERARQQVPEPTASEGVTRRRP